MVHHSRVPVRESTIQLFTAHKWIILIRDHPKEEWRVFANPISHRPYRYIDLDKAIYALKTIQHGRYRIGNAKLAKEEDYVANKVSK